MPQHDTARPWHPKTTHGQVQLHEPRTKAARRHGAQLPDIQTSQNTETPPLKPPPAPRLLLHAARNAVIPGIKAYSAPHTQAGYNIHIQHCPNCSSNASPYPSAGRDPPQRRQACVTRMSRRLPKCPSFCCVGVSTHHASACKPKSCVTGAAQREGSPCPPCPPPQHPHSCRHHAPRRRWWNETQSQGRVRAALCMATDAVRPHSQQRPDVYIYVSTACIA